MKIVLAEERNGRQLSELSFDKENIRFGRDPADCDIAFDNTMFPMVSRHHAELRLINKQWFLQDANSSYGTFIDGQKIVQAQAVRIGNKIQFGTQGPILRVIRLEIEVATPDFVQQSNQSLPISLHAPRRNAGQISG